MKTSNTAAAAAILAGAAVALMLASGTPFAAEPAKAGAADTMAGMKHDDKMEHDRHHGSLEKRVANAKTPHDHVMLADEYEAEAKNLEKKAADHESMAKTYTAFPGKSSGQSMAIHCRSIARSFREAAIENRDLAKFHREQSQKQN